MFLIRSLILQLCSACIASAQDGVETFTASTYQRHALNRAEVSDIVIARTFTLAGRDLTKTSPPRGIKKMIQAALPSSCLNNPVHAGVAKYPFSTVISACSRSIFHWRR